MDVSVVTWKMSQTVLFWGGITRRESTGSVNLGHMMPGRFSCIRHTKITQNSFVEILIWGILDFFQQNIRGLNISMCNTNFNQTTESVHQILYQKTNKRERERVFVLI
eukprot:Lithocolla_globosa_v1_NODE_3096_length_1767_cov_267.864486.p3 type:complete len:108 gc:universal NODE_3096_length_1767_cov_267.864486:1252-929(-)